MPQPGNAPAPRAENEDSPVVATIKKVAQATLMFCAINFFVGKFFTKPQANVPGSPAAVQDFGSRNPNPIVAGEWSPIPLHIAPIWPLNSSLDISIYISPSTAMSSLNKVPVEYLVLHEKKFGLGNWTDKREVDTSFPLPQEVQQNETLWAHVYVALHGYELDPIAPGYDYAKAYHFIRPLTQYLHKKKARKTKMLLGGSIANATEEAEEEGPKGPIISSFYHPNFTMSFIPDSGSQSYIQMHPAVRQHYNLEATGARDDSGRNGWYYPTLFVNTFWQLREHMTELNSTVKTLPLHITLNNLNNWKFSLYSTIDEGVKANARNVANGGPIGAAGDGSEFEEFKRVLVDTNIYLLSTTIIVSILHTVFEMLAFKSDISHWRNKKDNVGISVRTIIANVFMQTIIFLYLMDNSEGTSWMILFGQGMGIVLEAWKITKTVDVRIRPSPPGSWLPYHVNFQDKHKLSETEQKTKEYDEIAFRYMYMIAVPLIGAYAVYSVLYDSHKSWYSFVITTLVGSVYAYGFLMMVPSLYINYRLKSVAHMPAKAMTYKFLNTFIDDLFAFTIKMPTLHRLATLRDDVIFFVYLYQSWAYKVDYTRVNEFGQGGDDDVVEAKKAGKQLATSTGGVDTGASGGASIDKTAGASAVATASGVDGGKGRKRK